ncbi:AAA family ATPase [Geomicrobium sp. JCM 19055]|uniref:AAA family ATPase n=1 Tax=Geomicrobium sp. JCM 19055 TaxID=1460649 RepID=UPI00045ECD4E|nr:AAA family ATPase [Geomicrobium sp. JCM 19055]GAK00721.1 ClpB protein [Geomicrobium sp. JCM 19055]
MSSVLYLYQGPTHRFNYIIQEHSENDLISFSDVLFESPYITDIEQTIKNYSKADLYFNADIFSTVAEHLIPNLPELISRLYDGNYLGKIFIQNAPTLLIKNLKETFDDQDIYEETHKHRPICREDIPAIYEELNKAILGQERAIKQLMTPLFPLIQDNQEQKPIVVMLYGPPGVGKTETAKTIHSHCAGDDNVFRLQLSNFKNNEFLKYMSGGKVSEPSLARDLQKKEHQISSF